MAFRFDPEAMRALLLDCLPSSTSTGAADELEARRVYIPDRHTRALARDVAIVRGIRGTGKTLWWRALQDEALRARVAESGDLGYLRSASVTSGFGAGQSEGYPSPRVLSDLLAKKSLPAAEIWRAILLGQLAPNGLPAFTGWEARVRWGIENVEASEALLREADEALDERGQDHVVVFDALDRAGMSWPEVRAMVRGLLEVLVDLRELRRIRGKAFLRPEMLDHPGLKSFRDASKLFNDAADLDWRPTDLYALLFQHLGNDMARGAVFRDGCANELASELPLPGFERLEWREAQGVWSVPLRMRGEPALQERILTAIAGKYMGSNHRRGKVYTWLPDHLGDAWRQVSPRSFLVALRAAAEAARPKAAGPMATAIDHHGIKEGVKRASAVREGEISEDLPWVKSAIAPLEGMSVPAEETEVLSRWRNADLLGCLRSGAFDELDDARGLPSRFDEGYPGILRDLEEIGVLGRSADGRIQMPDVYRIAFQLKRRGGVPPVRR